MRINYTQRIVIEKVYGDLKGSQQGKKGETPSQEGEKELKNTKATRRDRIKELKRKVEEGTYQVDTELLAQKMLGRDRKK